MNEKINLNTASIEALQKLPGVGEGLANRIVTYRNTVGGFRTVAELSAISGISDRLAAQLRDRLVLAEAHDDVAPSNQLIFKVQLVDSQGQYTGYRVLASYIHFLFVVGQEAMLDSPEQMSVVVDASGACTMTLPPRAELKDPVTFQVFSPDGERLLQEKIAAEKLVEGIELRVKAKEVVQIEHSNDPNFGRPARLKGRVIDEAGVRQVANRQVVIWVADNQNPVAADFRALLVVKTDGNGYFSGDYPLGTFGAAYGAVSVNDEPEHVGIHLNEGGVFPKSVILVVDLTHEQAPDKEDCACHQTSDVPRDPDSADLSRADGTYSADPAHGRCVDFTKPDRTLEEFSYSYAVRTTQPEIKGFVLNEPKKIDIGVIKAILGNRQMQTMSSEFENEALTARAALFSPATMAVDDIPVQKIDAQILKTLARDPDGFSLTKVISAANLTVHADLIHAISQVVGRPPGRTQLNCNNPIDWDDEPTLYQACTIAHGHLLRFKQEWVSDGYSMGNLLYSLPLSPGQKKQVAVIDWQRTDSAGRSEFMTESESIEAEISRNRDVNEIVNGVVNESVRASSNSSSGSIAGGIGIGAIIGPVGALLGVGGGHSSASSSASQDASRQMAASALNQLRDRTVQSASSVRSQRSTVVQTVHQSERMSVTTETVANYNHCHAITIQYFEVLRHLLVRQRLTDVQECLFVPLLMSRFTSDKALRWRTTLKRAVGTQRLRNGFDALERIKNNYVGSDLPVGTYADQSLDYADGHLYLRFQLARPKDVNDDFEVNAWHFLSFLMPFISPIDFYKQYLKNQQLKDQIFAEQMAPKIAEAFVQHLQFFAVDSSNNRIQIPVDTTLTSSFANNRPLYVSLRLADALPPLARKDIQFIEINDVSGVLGMPLFQILPSGSRVIVESGSMAYRTKYSSGYLFNDARILNDLAGSDKTRIYTPLTREELRNPREEDKELARHLLDHLNEGIEHFHHVLWWLMGDDRRYMLLDGFEAPNSGGRSVASVVENKLIGIVGNSLVLPVARGFHLDPTYQQNVEEPVDLIEHYQPNTPIEPSRVAIPTRGVYAEAVMGACNSCEVKEEQRFWRWEESPIPDSPPAIQPVSTDSRYQAPPNLTAKDYPAPMINLQTAAAAPDPTGLAAALSLLGTPNIFKDMTGLEGTQKNAAAALSEAFDAAKFFGGKAADLAIQGKMAKDIDKTMRTIQTAKNDGLITDEQAQALTKNAISGLIGAGSSEQAKPMTTEEVKDVTRTAAEQGANVSVNRPSGETLQVQARPEANASAKDVEKSGSLSFSPTTNTAENRAFNPSSNDKSGVIDLEVEVRQAAAGSAVRWVATDPSAVTFDQPNSSRTRVRGLKSGKTSVDCVLVDSSGNEITRRTLQLCVPQFVVINEVAAEFDAALTDVQLLPNKDDVVRTAKTVCDHLLATSNVRTVWSLNPLGESVPAHLPASHITFAFLKGEPPVGRAAGLRGETMAAVGGGVGARFMNERIEVYTGSYDNVIPAGSTTEVDLESQAIALQLKSRNASDPDLEAFAVKVFGRLFGETLAHEIIHSLLGTLVAPGYHNSPAVMNDVMNQGGDRNFTARTGFVDNSHTSPVVPSHFTDNGIAAINQLQATNQALMNSVFPVPPHFA
ncbi:hypothetical protein DTO96_101052 [Ephemeroptericola cinctiostellae]|uniref:Helix-hairpin-helix DNA-binding motif class 1 domain-containing protein n=1 Tax=Ephemeroptericola cinctiostellae TaxID=2268024 RepID=A0A345DAD4_9BURK|nr:helix-hairpin-helix domain-containing protein [Ephemeroptericola cinctiostellae]AXF85322.1 hypothetical protein DTO96_101052 [Ephemeroptericola cinctiostellae]